MKKYGGTGLVSEKTEALYDGFNEREEVAVILQQAIYYTVFTLCFVANNHQRIQSRCLIEEFFFIYIINYIIHGYRADILKKNSLWLLPFYMTVATFCYY